VTVRADNVAGNGTASFPVLLTQNVIHTTGSTSRGSTRTLTTVVVALAVVAVFLGVVSWLVWRNARRKKMLPTDYRAIIDRMQAAAEAAGHTGIRFAKMLEGEECGFAPQELKRSDVVLKNEIGAGQFGQVFLAEMMTNIGRVRMAVKVSPPHTCAPACPRAPTHTHAHTSSMPLPPSHSSLHAPLHTT
jgi:hypothetical protein